MIRGLAIAILIVSLGMACRSRSTEPRGHGGPGIEAAVHDVGSELQGTDLAAIVVLQDGRRIAESYFNGATADRLHDVRSLTKSITSLLLGIAIDRGLVESLDDPVGDYLPGFDGALAGIRIRDLVTMRSGLAADDADPASPGNEDRLDRSRDWLTFARELPVSHPAGQVFRYASVNAFLVGAIVERAAGMGLDEFAREHLFGPLGIEEFRWRRGPQERVSGQGNLSITARDVAAIGQLCLDRGVHDGRLVVSAGWIDDSLAAHVSIATVDRYAEAYGFMWYRTTITVHGRTRSIHFASGNGGNKVYVIPDDHLVVAITSSAYDTDHGQARSYSILLRILAAIVDGDR